MPSKKGQKRAQGGGRVANSEPRIQMFKDFAGINFNNASEAQNGIVVDARRTSRDQTYLQMNHMFLQNNVMVASDKTLVVRDDIEELITPSTGKKFTGPVCLVGDGLYIAQSDGSLAYCLLEDAPTSIYEIVVPAGSGHTWKSFEYIDDKIIAMTSQNEIWHGDHVNGMYKAVQIPNPTATIRDNVLSFEAVGSLTYGATRSTTNKYRICIAFTFTNMFGPTKMCPKKVLYVSHPISEWSSARHLRLSVDITSFDPNMEKDINGVEFYYSADNATELIYLGRTTNYDNYLMFDDFEWYGYIDSTDTWTLGNLVSPTENYTKGVHASRVTSIDGRLYFWGDSSNPQRLYMGGNPGNLLSVSPGVGGGFVDVEPGTSKIIRYVCKYKTQSGNSIVTMLCDSPNTRKEQRYNLVENEVSLSNEQSMKSWQAEQVAGAVGCKSYNGAVVCEDGLYSISRYGLALTTMTMEYNSQIRTNYVSDNIKPVFIDEISLASMLSKSMLLELDGVLYMAFGNTRTGDDNLDNVIFCYDIDAKAWWTYTLDVNWNILGLTHIDSQEHREGIGIITSDAIYLLPTTVSDSDSAIYHDFLIETAEISTQMPQQGWQYLSQLEFHFDRFIGSMTIEVRMVDIFGRNLKVSKTISENSVQYNHVVRMRVDQKVMSYVITMSGTARFRMTHFLARVYTTSNKIGQVWGFDDSILHRSSGSIHPTFRCYNDIRKAIFT